MRSLSNRSIRLHITAIRLTIKGYFVCLMASALSVAGRLAFDHCGLEIGSGHMSDIKE